MRAPLASCHRSHFHFRSSSFIPVHCVFGCLGVCVWIFGSITTVIIHANSSSENQCARMKPSLAANFAKDVLTPLATLSSFLKNTVNAWMRLLSCSQDNQQNRLITAGTGEQQNEKEAHQINIYAKGCEKTNPKTNERMMSNLCILGIDVGVFCRI